MSTTSSSSSRATSRRCGIYVRISLDRKGEGLGVARQEKACRALAKARGWTVAKMYVDNDVSATTGKPRPEYLRMLADIEAGHLDAVAVWSQDRLVRKPAELEHFIPLADRHGVDLGTTTGIVDLGTPQGRMFARQLGAVAAYEGEHKAERMRAMWRQQAEMGKPHMGGPRPYGYLPDRVTVNHEEGAFIADAARRVLAGESLRSVALDMNARGARTVTGKAWSAPLLKQVLRTARISGRREIYPDGETSKGMGTIVATECWEPIISPEESDRLRTLFASRASTRNTRAKHLLTGLLTCGNCGGRMTGLAWEKGDKYLYRCPSNGSAWSRPTCGRLSVLMKHAHPVVRNVVLEALDSPEFWQRLRARVEVDPGVRQQVAKDEQTLIDLAGLMAAGDMSMAEWKTARDVVQARLDQGKALLARATNTNALAALEGAGDVVERWDALNVSQQRAVLAELLEQVTVLPAPGRRGERFQPERMVPMFRF